MQSGGVAGVRDQYGREAGRYDRRWADYLEATLPPTLEALELRAGARVLDIGCGTGLLLDRLTAREPAADAWGVDLSPDMLRRARARLGSRARLLLGDAARLPFPPAAFDAAATSSVLHHWPEPERSLAEIARVVRPGGQLVLTDWCNDHLPTRLLDAKLRWTDASHHRSYTLAQTRRLLRRAGFEVLRSERYRLGLLWGFMTLSARRSG